MEYDPKGDWSPASWLGAYVNVLWNEYLEYWELWDVPEESAFTPEQREFHRHMSELAEHMDRCLHTLRGDEDLVAKVREMTKHLGATADVNEDQAVLIAQTIHAHPIIHDGIKIGLAFEAADSLLEGAEKRAPELVALLSSRRLSDRAAAFLDRAARLFLWGFEPETVVMCGSVLEAAYESRFTALDMIRLEITKKDKDAEYQAYQYEQAALASGVYSREQKDLAAKVRRARNDTLHNAPNTTFGAGDALKSTATLLGCLFPA